MAIGAYAVERDYSHYVAYQTKTILAVVGTSTKGPLEKVTAVTNAQDMINKFGPLKVGCYGLYAAQYFLSQASKMYFVRAASSSIAPAATTVAGKTAADVDIVEGIIFELLEKGTYGNNYKIIVSKNIDDTYKLVVKNDKGSSIELKDNIAMTDLVEGFSTDFVKVTFVDDTLAKINEGTYTFSGGNDGINDITAADYIRAAQELAADTVDMNIVAIPGISDPAVITSVLSMVESRGDCLYLIDPPNGLTREGVVNWRTGSGDYTHAAFNSSYGAIYYDWLNIYDSVNKTYTEVPPSVVVSATIAYSDRISELWYAPAGLIRGLVRGALSCCTQLNKSDVELLYDSGINSIYTDPISGLVVWGQKTAYQEKTALDRINVRRLLNYLKRVVTGACNYLVFEPNDRVTWNSFEMKVQPVLESLKAKRGIYEYRIVRGETIVTAGDIDNYRMPCMIMIKPTKSAEEIPIYFVITSTGADFNEVLEANGVVVQS